MATAIVTPAAPATTTPDPEMEFLKAESGLNDTELDNYKAILGDTKFRVMLTKIKAAKDQAATERATAETERLALERRLNDEVYPEVRRVAQDSVRAQGELARAQAELKAAREYGIVPGSVEGAAAAAEPPRAPGSPAAADPQYATRDDLGRYRGDTARTVLMMSDLQAEYQSLTGKPLMGAQELYDELQRQHTLGHKDATLKTVWESKYEIPRLRSERAAADKQKEMDAYADTKVKAYRESHGDNGNLATGKPSRHSRYDASGKPGATPRWQAPQSRKQRNEPWRQEARKKLEATVN